MFQFRRADEHHVILSDLFDAVAHDPPDTGTMLDEVQFKFLVAMERIGKLRLVSLDYIETVFFR